MDLEKLLQALKEAGVTHYKTADLELRFSDVPVKPVHVPVDAPVSATEEIKHEVHELTSLLKLSDVELVDRLFPDTQPEEAEESA